ncbi:alkaline phosphatase D family protein [Arhodomonas sp. AD133]|uniref:alkaline phosphatase D family protein n=1 Tax=Arhodomonas sp. AD133 TaxID=3415009 RepID=UPI003EB891B6
MTGHFRTPPASRADVRFVWGGDVAGQGWGIDESRGGMRIFETMRALEPDFFIHSGDSIYADGPLAERVELADGGVWRNRLTPAKAKVAETLDEFRGNYRYNLLDANLRAFNAQVPTLAQWDDHETRNNWYPGEMLADDERYTVKSASLLAARARRAFLDYMPLRPDASDPERIYRRCPMGPHLEVFFLDMRSYRGANSANRQPEAGAQTALLGSDQVRWLKRALFESTATWKVIASDMPIGLMVRDGDSAFENAANGDGPPLGREHEIAALLRFIHHNDIDNVVWLTADVHYAAAHHYDPGRARFSDFRPFWEFVSGPLHAGTFGPNELDDTFGPKVAFQKAPPDGQANLPPSAGLQFFGDVRIAGDTGVMTVALRDASGEAVYQTELTPVA